MKWMLTTIALLLAASCDPNRSALIYQSMRPADHDLIEVETWCECVMADVLRGADTLLAVSIHPKGKQYRVLPKTGPWVTCDEVRFLPEKGGE